MTLPAYAELSHQLALVGQNDRNALRAVYKATSAKLLGVVERILQDRGESEDVLQEVYVSVWRQAGSFDSTRGKAMGWLIAIARNRALDRLRQRVHIPVSATMDAADHAHCPMPSALAELEQSEDARQLDQALNALDQRSAWIIRTAFLDGATYEALSARMGAPLGTVKSLARRGLLKLRASLLDEGVRDPLGSTGEMKTTERVLEELLPA